MGETAAHAPAGWYSDPEVPGQLRWWDGGRWAPSLTTPVAAPPSQLFTNFPSSSPPAQGTSVGAAESPVPSGGVPFGGVPSGGGQRGGPPEGANWAGALPGYQAGALPTGTAPLVTTPPGAFSSGFEGAWNPAEASRRRRGRLVAVLATAGVLILASAGAAFALTRDPSLAAARSVADTTTTDLAAKNYAGYCSAAIPAQRSACLSQFSGAAATITNFRVGEVTVEGNEALFVDTGTICVAGTCHTNADPKAGLDDGKTFAQVYALEISSTQVGPPWVSAMMQVGGTWYLTGFTGSSGGPGTGTGNTALTAWAARIQATFVAMTTALRATSTDTTTAAVLADCSSMTTDARSLQAMPAAPVAVVNAPWQTGLADVVVAGTDCVAALPTGNGVQLGQANASASAAEAAFQQFATELTQAEGG